MKDVTFFLKTSLLLLGISFTAKGAQESKLIKIEKSHYVFDERRSLKQEEAVLDYIYSEELKLDVPPAPVTISGYIKEKSTGEDLIGASFYVHELKMGTVANEYGFYSLSIPAGTYTVSYSFLGTKTETRTLEVLKDQTINIELGTDNQQIEEVVVTAGGVLKNVERAEMSVVRLPVSVVKGLPALMGESDLIKTIQMLPGIKPAAEGSSGFSVRGGNPDQNLLLLDEAPVYNAAHLLGFFSVFNGDALSDLKMYKGDIPASFGGRLASLLDIRMKNGNSKKFSGSGGIGTVSSRLTLEGPIGKQEKTSFLLAGRRSYADLFLKLSSDEKIKNNTVYFYDLNAKVNHRFNDKNRLFISSYMGTDKFKSDESQFAFGNQTVTVRWNHLFSNKLFSNTTFLYSKYNYELSNELGVNAFKWNSNLEDYSAKLDFNYFLNSNNKIKFGAAFTYHQFEPGHAFGLGDEAIFGDYKVDESNALELGAYLSNEQKLGDRLTLKYGLRLSMFSNVGEGTVYDLDENYEVTGMNTYKKGDVYNTYVNLEPRLGLKFTLDPVSSVKASYSRTVQYMQLAQNSTGGMPLDIWFPSSPNVKPQKSDQFALGYFRNFRDNTIEMSLETYYKKLQNSIDFKDFAELLLNKELDAELRFGSTEAYGFEFMTNLNFDRLQGWFGYTWSRTERTIEEINDGVSYRSPYDVPHDFKAALSYKLTPRTLVSANFTYSTGKPITYPVGRGEYQGSFIKIYSDRNAYRMPDNHRLDLALTLKGKKKPNQKWEGEWNFSLYNAYGRKNPWYITFKQDEDNSKLIKAEKTYLFTFVPSITYNFKF